MSIIGPRPALWNQDVLTAERDKYGANDVKPGLTGWAQINGRDELEIPEKARLDGEYIDFEHQDFRKPGSPKELDMNDIEAIAASNRFFARKFDARYDKNVIDYYINVTGCEGQIMERNL